ncbi:uncharacterized protein LOC117428513 [Acipenser ruthenus]|uniref:uncharacterized protein LOC117428513 n=1 Tax=Acipenser ruthenus TaxID=7906 RepID=UPI0027406EB9|nr:uncharacterized protein LOC117428513 [Acipenser ruthenus]
METMEEFDRECPMIKTFCQLLSQDEFEEQALSYTERALLDLFRTMDQNPELYERVIRKRKQGELEKASVGSCLKAKFFTAVEGQMNRCNAVGAAELRQRVGHLKEEMKKVQAYAQEAKCAAKRTSKRLAERRQKTPDECDGDEQAPPLCVGPPPSAPPPPPPLPPSTALPEAQTPLKDRTNHRKSQFQMVATPDLLNSYGLSRLNRRCSSSVDLTALSESEPESSSNPHHNIQYELLASIPLKRLRATGIVRSPGGTPLNTPRKSQPKSGEESSPASAFNTALITKFRNALSPPGTSSLDSPERSDSDADSSGFATPHGTP